MEDREQNVTIETGTAHTDVPQAETPSKRKRRWLPFVLSAAMPLTFALIALSMSSLYEYNCWYGPFAKEDVIILPMGYEVYVTPIGEDDTCRAVGDGRLALIGSDLNGFVMAQYRRGSNGAPSERECPNSVYVVMSLRDWNWAPYLAEYYLRSIRENEERRAAEHGFLRGWFIDPP